MTYEFRTVVCLYLAGLVYGDYECLCNYNVETGVHPSPDTSTSPIGYMYEFDCKPTMPGLDNAAGFAAIQFETEVGYIKTDDNMQTLTCQGDASKDDLVTSTSAPRRTTMSGSSTATPTTIVTQQATTTKQTTTVASTTTTIATTKATDVLSSSTTPKLQLWQSANVSGTPLQFIGIGYNLLEGNPDGNLVSMVNTDPGLMLQQRIFQLTDAGNQTVKEAEYQLYSQCIAGHNVSLLNSGYAYQQQMLSNIKTHDTSDTILSWAFTYSNDFSSTSSAFETNKDTMYKDVRDTCQYGRGRMTTSHPDAIHVSRDFARAVCQISKQNDDIHLYNFIEQWGTNIITAAAVGSMDAERYETTTKDVFLQALNKAPEVVQHTGPFGQFNSSLTLTSATYSSSKAANVTIGNSVSYITIGSGSKPQPLSLELVSLAEALNFTYWQKVIPQLMVEDICPEEFNQDSLLTTQRNLASALHRYPTYKYNVTTFNRPVAPSRSPIRIPVTWPHGTYTLMQATSGCPTGGVNWFTGNRFQDTEDSDSHNYYSADLGQFLKGEFDKNNIRTYYCSKTTGTSNNYDMGWPSGNYCILKYTTCPAGFTDGFIDWDDEDHNNGNTVSGILPTGSYTKNTRIYYCCRSDGPTNSTITLPTDNPFILMRYSDTCQQVYGMRVHEVYLRWDDQDFGNHDSSGGTHPYDAGGDHDHLLYFCHYERDATGQVAPPVIG